jgi:hypothetical protein
MIAREIVGQLDSERIEQFPDPVPSLSSDRGTLWDK